MRSLVRLVLEGVGHRVIECDGCPQAHALLSNGLHPDLLLIESVSTAGAEWEAHLQLLRSVPRQNVCLVMGIGEQGARKQAVELGIRHFLVKPVTRGDVESMVDELSHAPVPAPVADTKAICAANPPLAECVPPEMPPALHLEELGDNGFFLAASPTMLEIYRQVKLLADVDVPVLILGESGTGKEVIAHLIHKYSRRSGEKFLNVNCAALPTELLESELFGHRQGAFTGAIKDRAGKFEQANRGTLLLDEIGEISVQMQAKLLHVLQDGEFTRLGGQESTRVDVRVLAATNVEMDNALLEKTFREDLFYRLNTFTINVPPLRERREEIPYLIEEIIRRSPGETRKSSDCGFCSRLMDAALLYDWRGNLRELRNFVTRTIIMRDPDGGIRELESKIAAMNESAGQDRAANEPYHCPAMRSFVRDVKDRTEVQMIRDALEVSGWNRRRAAKYLDISYRGLLYKIQQHRLTPGVPKDLNEAIRRSYSARGDTAA
jgi:DNA-binding NtrC family response regulator